MICYRDRTWCSDSINCGSECLLKITKEQIFDAREQDLPIAWADYKDTEMCLGYTPKIKEKDDRTRD